MARSSCQGAVLIVAVAWTIPTAWACWSARSDTARSQQHRLVDVFFHPFEPPSGHSTTTTGCSR